MVVTQPGFIYHSGDRYLEQLAEQDIANLYPLKAWLDAGLPVATSSDAPVVPPEPLAGIQAAYLASGADRAGSLSRAEDIG